MKKLLLAIPVILLAQMPALANVPQPSRCRDSETTINGANLGDSGYRVSENDALVWFRNRFGFAVLDRITIPDMPITRIKQCSNGTIVKVLEPGHRYFVPE